MYLEEHFRALLALWKRVDAPNKAVELLKYLADIRANRTALANEDISYPRPLQTAKRSI